MTVAVFAPYTSLAAAGFALAILLLAQILVADVAGIRARHVPGTPVTGGHDDFLFRATRTHANTNEVLGLFLLLLVVAIVAGADPRWSAAAAWGFVAARAGYAVCYYADWRTARSVVFGAGLLAQAALLAACLAALW